MNEATEVRMVTVNVIEKSLEALQEISNKDIPIRVGVALARNIKEVNEILEVYNKNRMSLYEKYGEKNEDTGDTKITDENLDIFSTEFDALKAEEIGINTKKINADDLGDINLRASTLLVLDWLIEI